jgi:DNA-binding NtrC family response regulator
MPAWGFLYGQQAEFFLAVRGVFFSRVPLPEIIRGRMTPPFSPPALLLWVADKECRDLLVNILTAQEYAPRVVGQPAEALQTLKGHEQATVFVDCQVVSTHGPGLYAKLKVACPPCRVVLLCEKRHLEHRDIVKEAMDLGIYACLLAPFADWEVLAMVRHGQAGKSPGRRPPRSREKH